MGIDSTSQASDGVLHSPAGNPVHPQSVKPLLYPTAVMRTIIRKRRRLRWWGVEDEDDDKDYNDEEYEEEEEEEEDEVDDDEEEEEEEVVVDDAERDRIVAILNQRDAKLREAAGERMRVLADRCERSKENDSMDVPPMEMWNYPDLFERAWGWDRMLPRQFDVAWSRYKEYLSEYYSRNIKESDGDADDGGNGLPALARSCVKMEEHLLFLWNKLSSEHPHADDRKIRRISDMITKCSCEMTNVKVEYPAAAVALKCITAEAELMYSWLLSEDTERIFYIRMCNEIRHCALSFMAYKGPERVVAMAAMMGITKEAKGVCRLLRGKSMLAAILYRHLYLYTVRQGRNQWTGSVKPAHELSAGM